MSAKLLQACVMDFGLMSVLLVIAHLLRARVRLFQNIFLPTSIIAGFLGLIGGWQFLDWLPFGMTRSEDRVGPVMAWYPGVLVVILFATLFMGQPVTERVGLRKLTRDVGDTFFYNLASLVGMYGLALLFGVLVLAPLFPDLHRAFSLMLPAGFVGGHGTANAVGGALEESIQWQDAATIGYTFATVGLLTAIFGGMVLINIATRRGWTRLVQSAAELPDSIKKGFVPEEERASIGQATVSPLALDPLTWHVALVMAAFAAAFGIKHLAEGYLPVYCRLPAFCLALLAGALIQKLLDVAQLGQYVDRRIMVRIGSFASDYLIAFGIASIRITVVVDYAVPLVIMVSFGILYCVGLFWFIGRRIFRTFWFERSIFVYGWNTGVVGMGVMLLRIVDPRMKTPTLHEFGLAYVFISVAEISLVTFVPMLVAGGTIAGPGIILSAAFLVCIILSRYLVGWFPYDASELREGEAVGQGHRDQHQKQREELH